MPKCSENQQESKLSSRKPNPSAMLQSVSLCILSRFMFVMFVRIIFNLFFCQGKSQDPREHTWPKQNKHLKKKTWTFDKKTILTPSQNYSSIQKAFAKLLAVESVEVGATVMLVPSVSKLPVDVTESSSPVPTVGVVWAISVVLNEVLSNKFSEWSLEFWKVEVEILLVVKVVSSDDSSLLVVITLLPTEVLVMLVIAAWPASSLAFVRLALVVEVSSMGMVTVNVVMLSSLVFVVVVVLVVVVVVGVVVVVVVVAVVLAVSSLAIVLAVVAASSVVATELLAVEDVIVELLVLVEDIVIVVAGSMFVSIVVVTDFVVLAITVFKVEVIIVLVIVVIVLVVETVLVVAVVSVLLVVRVEVALVAVVVVVAMYLSAVKTSITTAARSFNDGCSATISNMIVTNLHATLATNKKQINIYIYFKNIYIYYYIISVHNRKSQASIFLNFHITMTS